MKSAPGPARDQQIGALAARQQQLITTAQLRDLGVSQNAIQNRANRGLLHRLHHGVYATHPPPHSRNQRWLAAVLACGPGAGLSHEPAAILQGFLDPAPVAQHVTAPGGRGRTRSAIIVHRGTIDPRDRRIVERIPCTSADRVLIDLAPAYEEPRLETMLVAAESLGLLKRSRLADLIDAYRGRPGVGKLARITALEPALTHSGNEALFLPVCRAAGVARPKVNLPIAVPTDPTPLVVDFAWPEIRLVVELDSQRFHGDWQQAELDRERDQCLALAGWVSHRFVPRVLHEEPGTAAMRLRALHEARLEHPAT